MGRFGTGAAAAAVVAALGGVVLAATTQSLPLGGGDWPQYRHDVQSTWANAGSFDAAAVASLNSIWTFSLGASGFAQPAIVGDTVYVTSAGSKGGKVFALDAATGTLRWSRDTSGTFSTRCGTVHPGITGAPAVVNGVVYAGGGDGAVWALDAQTGATIWRAPVADPVNAEEIQASPVVSTALGKLYIGTSSHDEECFLPAGKIAAIDLATGTALVRQVPQAGHLGATIWSSITVDEQAGVAYATTGNSPSGASGDPLSQAIIAYDARTLDVLDHWQDPFAVSNDGDFGASATLFTTGGGRLLVGAANKDGWLYVFDRGTLAAGPIWKYQLAFYGSPENGQSTLVAPTFDRGVLYAAGGATPDGHPGSVVALDPATGAVQWRHIPLGYVLPGMPSVGEVIVVAANTPDNTTHNLELLDATTGNVLRTFTGPSPIWGAPAVGRGLFVFVTATGTVTAMQIGAAASDGGPTDGGMTDGGATDGGTTDGGTADGGASGGPTAVIEGGPFSGNPPLDVYLDATASQNGTGDSWVTTISWDFGDGTLGAKPWLVHTFEAAGTYTVRLTLTDNLGRIGTATRTVQVGSATTDGGTTDGGTTDGGTTDGGTTDGGMTDGGATDGGTADVGGTGGPTAVIEGGPFSGNPPLDMYLDATSSKNGTGGSWVTTISWDLGDGTSSTNPWLLHTYGAAGTYTVRLTLTDNLGRVGMATRTIQVGSATTDGGATDGGTTDAGTTGGGLTQPMNLVIDARPGLSGKAPFSVELDATRSTTTDPKDWITSVTWQLGDGVTSTAPWLDHTYRTPGTYLVTLTATDAFGNVQGAIQTVTVQ